jgi:hypothetical protein
MTEPETQAPAEPRKAAAVDPAAQARREASLALFALAILQLGFTGLMALIRQLMGVPLGSNRLTLELALTIGFGIAFAGLGMWARYRTLPAAVVGLVLYVVFAVLNVALGVILILLAVLLVKAIRTCLKIRG